MCGTVRLRLDANGCGDLTESGSVLLARFLRDVDMHCVQPMRHSQMRKGSGFARNNAL